MTSSADVRSALRGHLKRAGLSFGRAPERLDGALRREMGRRRFDRYVELAVAYADGLVDARRFYGCIRTAREAALFWSHQADLTLRGGAWLVERVVDRAPEGAVIAELGCWSGAFARFLALRRPDATVVGVDRLATLLRLARAGRRAQNLVFRRWDYTTAPPQAMPACSTLVSILGVDFLWGEDDAETPGASVRGTADYRSVWNEAFFPFRNWRRAAKADAVLGVVLRLPSLTRSVAAIDAADAAGWRWDRGGSAMIRVRRTTLAALRFDAAAPRLDAPPKSAAPWRSVESCAYPEAAPEAEIAAWARRGARITS